MRNFHLYNDDLFDQKIVNLIKINNVKADKVLEIGCANGNKLNQYSKLLKSKKNYDPELNFHERKEIIESIKYVTEVIPSPWLITNEFLNNHSIDLLIHGNDNENPIKPDKLLIVKRTKGISSSLLRKRVLYNLRQGQNENPC